MVADSTRDGIEIPFASFDRAAHERLIGGAACSHEVNQGQSHFALAKIISQVLAGLVTIAGVVQHIIDDLKGRPQAQSKLRGSFNHWTRCTRNEGAKTCCCLKEFGRFVADHL